MSLCLFTRWPNLPALCKVVSLNWWPPSLQCVPETQTNFSLSRIFIPVWQQSPSFNIQTNFVFLCHRFALEYIWIILFHVENYKKKCWVFFFQRKLPPNCLILGCLRWKHVELLPDKLNVFGSNLNVSRSKVPPLCRTTWIQTYISTAFTKIVKSELDFLRNTF